MKSGLQGPAAAAVAGLFISLLSTATPATASNEAFYLPKRIYGLDVQPRGWNLVALPARNPYQGPLGLTNLCRDLHLDPEAMIIQFDGQGRILAHVCSMAPSFQLLDGRGVLIESPRLRDGSIVGSDNLTKTIPIFDLGTAPRGTNLFPVDFHTTFVTPEDLCSACGLSPTASVARIDALSGMVLTHRCGQIPSWNLVRGEAVLVLEDQGPKSCQPAHF
jgi:hypothetical protein